MYLYKSPALAPLIANTKYRLELQRMSDQHSQALSTPPAPLEAGSRKRSGLFATEEVLFSALCQDALDYYRRPRAGSVSYSIRGYCRRGVVIV